MNPSQKEGRYQRIYEQLKQLLSKPGNALSRQATVVAVLHHKMEYFFWTGFYLLDQEELIVGPYQGPAACQLLEKNKGVCWAGINQGQAVIVADVHQFPGHIACDSRSQSEIVLPLRNKAGDIIGVLDVDSKELNSFDEADRVGLQRILDLLTEFN